MIYLRWPADRPVVTSLVIESEPFPYPGTLAARKHGCLCPSSPLGRRGTVENPWLLDRNCPLHGCQRRRECASASRSKNASLTTELRDARFQGVTAYCASS